MIACLSQNKPNDEAFCCNKLKEPCFKFLWLKTDIWTISEASAFSLGSHCPYKWPNSCLMTNSFLGGRSLHQNERIQGLLDTRQAVHHLAPSPTRPRDCNFIFLELDSVDWLLLTCFWGWNPAPHVCLASKCSASDPQPHPARDYNFKTNLKMDDKIFIFTSLYFYL